ncbi:ribonucleotide reductase subunit alpha [Thiomonas sp.]|uniref:Uncharacterized protein n=1 Tax=mine drainage metagenome TaxID=410659 RepID=E6PQK7_9ZZZZ
MEINNFNDLLEFARRESEPQRLLLVFIGATLPENASAEQIAAFHAGKGGELEPVMYVDKDPHEILSFEALTAESADYGPPWSLVFTSSVSWRDGRAPTSEETEASLHHMIECIRAGLFEGMLPFDRDGEPVHLVSVSTT